MVAQLSDFTGSAKSFWPIHLVDTVFETRYLKYAEALAALKALPTPTDAQLAQRIASVLALYAAQPPAQ